MTVELPKILKNGTPSLNLPSKLSKVDPSRRGVSIGHDIKKSSTLDPPPFSPPRATTLQKFGTINPQAENDVAMNEIKRRLARR